MTSDISISKPVSIWNKPLKANFKDFFKGLTKATLSGLRGNIDGVLDNATEAISSVGLGDEPGQIAWLLIYRSIQKAIYILVNENLEILKIDKPEIEVDKICEELNLLLENTHVTIDKHFFQHPEKLPFLDDIKKILINWLVWINLKEAQAKTISQRFPSYFLSALNEEWRFRSKEYECLSVINTPFTKASEREKALLDYSAKLRRRVDEPIFDEVFSLKQVYVPLRAYYELKSRDRNEKHKKSSFSFLDQRQTTLVVCDLAEEVEQWLNHSDQNDSIRIISGDPGSGKSSFSKMFACWESAKNDWQVLFISLHQFDLKGDLLEAIENYFSFEFLLPQPVIDVKDQTAKWLIIFDGLDELTGLNKIFNEVAQQFILEVQKKVDLFNMTGNRLKVLISGRQLVVQANKNEFRKPHQILHVLSYYIAEQDRELYSDPNGLLRTDQRDIWWEKYGIAIGKEGLYPRMPQGLKRKDLTLITAQPLLNYLIALSLELGVDFSKTVNLNNIYADLLKAVYRRGWEKNAYPSLKGIEEDQFVRLLEEIALSAWHGSGRTTTVKEIEIHCDNSRLNDLLEGLQDELGKGIIRLLMAFYFRQSGRRNNETTFEFTHKTFEEYLTAKCIVHNLSLICEEVMRHRNSRYVNRGWDERTALAHWIKLFSVVAIDRYIFKFIVREIELQPTEHVKEWQKILISLINFMLRQGMPMETLNIRPSYQQECYQSRNAEESLMVILSACARFTKEVSDIDWPTKIAFGEWLSKMQGQRIDYKTNTIFFDCLNWLNLSDCILLMKDISAVNFSLSNLERVNLSRANLVLSNLTGANLTGANLTGANLIDANLTGANLTNVDLIGANLADANLTNANLTNANLERVNLTGANLTDASVRDANLAGANLTDADLTGANLAMTNLAGANLTRANLTGANLTGANLARINLSLSNLSKTTWIDGMKCLLGSVGKPIFEEKQE